MAVNDPNTCWNCLTSSTRRPTSKLVSPVPHLLGSNSIPELLDDKHIRTAIAQVSTSILQLDAEIVEAQAALEGLAAERKKLHSFVEEHIAFLSPARRMLGEIWSEIFMHCLPIGQAPLDMESKPSQELERRLARGRTSALLTLMRVCSDWRSIAAATPRLWSSISLAVHAHEASSIEAETLKVQTWLSRSGACPLNIRIFGVSDHWINQSLGSPLLPQYDAAMRCLVSASHRWGDVYMLLSSASEAARTLAPIRGNLISLQSLAVELQHHESEPIPDHLDVFELAPRLAHLRLFSASSISVFKFPTSQLTRCSTSSWTSPHEGLEILKESPNLVEYAFYFSSVNTWPPLTESVTHMGLRVLTLAEEPNHMNTTTKWIEIFDHLSLPSLSELRVQTNSQLPQLQLRSFLSRISNSLSTLEFRCNCLTDRALIQCLKETPYLAHLAIRVSASCHWSSVTSDYMMEELSYREETQRLVPHLRSIKLEGCNFGAREFMRMIWSRWNVRGSTDLRGDRLESVSLLLYHLQSKERLEGCGLSDLRELKDEGMNVEVFGVGPPFSPSLDDRFRVL